MNTLTITLAVLTGLFAVALIVSIVTRPKVVTLSDEAPKGLHSAVMKLQNELKSYVYEKDGKICIDVVKK